MSVSMSSASYPFRAAMLLSQDREAICQWKHYDLRAMLLESNECHLAIGQRDCPPHLIKTFESEEACLDYLREHDLPASGWMPMELVQVPQLKW
jgi:hypothetical protein